MYSVVLATMLTAGTGTTPAWHHGCHGCHGCCGGYTSCCGGYSCCGGSCCGGYSSCCGGYASCHGCHGCHGGAGYAAGYGGYAGAYAYGGYGCFGAYPYYGCNGCFGVFGCGGGYSGGVASFSASSPYRGGLVSAPMGDGGAALALAEAEHIQRNTAVAQAEAPAVATRVTVKLPADAKLYVNNDPCPLTSTTRAFETPKLNADQDYTYTIKAQVTRNGQTYSESKKVVFKAGQPVSVNFDDLGSVRTAQK